MKVGTENKKAVYALTALGLVAAYLVYSNFLSGPSYSSSSASSPAPAAAVAPPIPGSEPETQAAAPPRAPSSGGRTDEFKPVLRSKRPEERIDPTRVDPTLRLDLLARLQDVPAASGAHNLFQIGPAPPKVEPPTGPETRIAMNNKWLRPPPLPPPPGPPPPPPPKQAVPINVKYYGWVAPSGSERRKAFFLDGDDILVKTEGEAIKGHYRVVRIGPTAVVVEDTNDKLQQTLPKVEDATV